MTIPRSFYFLRHGETDWNLEGRMQGWTDIPLNATGRAQAAAALPALLPLGIDLIVASPLSRAYETALITNEKLQKPLVSDARLRERGSGIFEGRPWREHDAWRQAAEQDPHAAHEETGYPCPDGAEPYADFKARIAESVTEHLVRDGNILFVAHGGVYRVLRRLLTDGLDKSPNAKPYLFEKSAAGWTLRDL